MSVLAFTALLVVGAVVIISAWAAWAICAMGGWADERLEAPVVAREERE